MYYLASAFALSMLPGNARMVADVIPDEYVRESLGQYLAERDVYSVVGHQATADMMSALLGIEVVVNREAIQVNYGDSIYVCQAGVRPSEGHIFTEEEIAEIPFTFWVVTVMRPVQPSYGDEE